MGGCNNRFHYVDLICGVDAGEVIGSTRISFYTLGQVPAPRKFKKVGRHSSGSLVVLSGVIVIVCAPF